LKSISIKQKDVEPFHQTYSNPSTKNLIKKIKDFKISKEKKDFQDKQKILQQMKHRRFVK
jgi:hypothetical protein